MNLPQTILTGTDYSDISFQALRVAGHLAQSWPARLVALHVIDRSELEDLRAQVDISEETVLERAQPQLDKSVRQMAGPEVNVETELIIGHPFAEILQAAERTGAGLLVLGAHGSGSERDRTGTLATRCVRKAPLPVLLVRENQDFPFRRITACVDFSETSREALLAAVLFARKENAALDILHVRRPPVPGFGDSAVPSGFSVFDIPLPPYQDASEYVAHQEQLFSEFLKPVEHALEGVAWNRHSLEDLNPAQAMAAFLRDSGSSVVVLGTRGRTGLRNLLLGSTAEKIIHRAPCSVLAIKPAGFEFQI
ncbi:MAG TPA: universal stress protein [Verrucomicrobiales bacterium]|nr:universal stress protein [Verrucomicrobiales bacterium]